MATTESSPTGHRDEQESCSCYGGFIYIGYMVEDEYGDEVEVFDAVPCSRCHAARETS